MTNNKGKFSGWKKPEQNWSHLPHEFIEHWGIIDTLAELKVVLYILRHTWGFQEYDGNKKITIDEFSRGRKLRDGRRFDSGTGMSEPSVRSGLEKALEHGFILVEEDRRDMARQKKYYSLNMKIVNQGVKDFTPDENDLPPDYKTLSPGVEESLPRSEKDTSERNSKKKPIEKPKASDFPELVLHREVVRHWCKNSQREIVISAIQKVNARLGHIATRDELLPYWQEWCKVSGNEWSLVWLTDWAVSGSINGKKKRIDVQVIEQPEQEQDDPGFAEALAESNRQRLERKNGK